MKRPSILDSRLLEYGPRKCPSPLIPLLVRRSYPCQGEGSKGSDDQLKGCDLRITFVSCPVQVILEHDKYPITPLERVSYTTHYTKQQNER
jgi:hypothetical protein